MLNINQGFTYNKFEKPSDWPKVEDTFDYKYDNGKLIGGNKNLFLSGPANYTVVGSPTIKDGIASGFSASNCIKTASQISSSANSIYLNLRFSLSSVSDWQTIMSISASVLGRGFEVDPNNQTYFSYLNTNNENTIIILGTIQNNTFYDFILQAEGTSLQVKLVQGITEIANITKNDCLLADLLGQPQFGYLGISVFQGSIDFNHTYIKVNDRLWFYGKNYTTSNMVPVPKGLEYNNTTTPSIGWVDTDTSSSNFQQFTSAPEGTMIGKDDTHSLAVETYQDKGIVDYTVVGSPTIKDGIASGFSDNDYLLITSVPSTTKEYKLVTEFTTGTSFPGYKATIIGTVYGFYSSFGFLVQNDGLLKFNAYLNNADDTSQSSYLETSTGVTLTTNQKYYAELVISNSSHTITSRISTDKQNWTVTNVSIPYNNFGILANETRIGIGKGQEGYFTGSVDLNNTYIMINGQYWFYPYPNSYPKLVGPANYTVVGSTTIENGIVSGFSASNYLETSQIAGTDISEFVFKFNTKDLSSDTMALSNGASMLPVIQGSSYRLTIYFNDDTSANLGGYLYGLVANTDYWLKYTNDGTTLRLFLSTNGIDYTLKGEEQWASKLSDYRGDTFKIGGPAYPFKGSIDLNNTYIKVNGALWFGKENWKPSTYTDNSIYLLTSHKSNYSQYNELDFTPEITDNTTYNVSIDNQEIFTGMSSGTHIEWDKLALTTGYNITTPSTLKAHVIKISPTDNTKNITRYYCDSNYIIKDGKLVWADPRIYLKGDGVNTYIDTGIKVTSTTTMELNAICDTSYTTGFSCLAGSRNSTSPYNRLGIVALPYSGGYYGFRFDYGEETNDGSYSFSNGNKYKFLIEENKLYINDVLLSTATAATLTSENNLYLFGNNIGGYSDAGTNQKITYSKIIADGSLVRHFVPVPAGLVIGNFTVPSNGMFDIVNQQFYPNQGTGNFTYGKDFN